MQPISLLMSHFNVENTAQLTPGAIAAAQDVAQSQEIVKEGIQVAQTVQANEAAAEAKKVHGRTEDEEREDRRRNARDSYERGEGNGQEEQEDGQQQNGESKTGKLARLPVVTKASRNFEFYV